MGEAVSPRARKCAIRLAFLVPLLTVAFLAVSPTSARAAVSSSMHTKPGGAVSGVTQLCGPDPAYSCTSGGYSGQSTGWPGTLYGAGYASSNSYGYHNCTLYAAYRLASNGLGNPGWSANANGWATSAYAAGTPVDQTPAVGSIAQWNSGLGHVAYVEVVTSTYIEITDDNYGLNTTDRFRIATTSPAWPDNFIHFKDMPAPTDTDTDGVVDAAPDWCIYDKGNATNRGCPNSIHQLSGDFNGDGKDDVVYLSRGLDNSPGLGWFQSTSTLTTTSVADPVGFSVSLPAPSWNVDGLKWATGDFNGDGKDDLLAVSGSGSSGPVLYIFLSDGTQLTGPTMVAAPNPAYWLWDHLEWFVGDFNGDGKDDVMYASRGPDNSPGLGWFQSTSTGMTASLASPIGLSVVLPAPGWNVDNLKWSVGDFNGDGKADMFVVSGSQTDGPGLYVLLSTGSQLANPVNVKTPNPTYWKWDRLVFMTGDVDGDGRSDVIYISRGPNNDPGLGWFQSTSSGTTASLADPRAFTVVLPAPAWNMSGLKWAVIDANGDGRADILSVSGAGASGPGIYILPMTGSGTSSQLSNPVNVSTPNPAYWQWWRLQF